MSATNGKPGELTAISKAKDLVNHTMWASNKVFPKSVRFTLSQRMETAALERGYIDIRRCEDWTKKILDVKNLTASWRKKDAARFSPKG